jgi:stress-induced morphogen
MVASRQQRIFAALEAALAPSLLEVEDQSRLHAGHAGAQPGGETHYAVLAISEAFRGRSRVERSRLVHQLLAPEFAAGLHALALTLRAPEERIETGT